MSLITHSELRKLQVNPNIFINKILGATLDSNQKKIVEAVANYDRVVVASCHSIGKTFTSARLALWFLYCYPDSLVLTTAPTERQVSFLLWGEIRKAFEHSKIPLGGKLRAGNLLEVIEKEWYAVGFSPQVGARPKEMLDSVEQQKVVIQGWHGDFVFVILDEAVGIEADIWTQIEGLLTSGKVVKVLAIGNPTTKNCIFHKLFSSPVWRSIYVTCFNTPNMIANGLTNMEKLTQECERLAELSEPARLTAIKKYKRPVSHVLLAGWVVERFLQWGPEDPRFQGKAIGVFPETDDMAMITEKVVEMAQNRTHFANPKGIKFIGVDVARKGSNQTVFTELQEAMEKGDLPVQTRLKRLKNRDLMSVTGELVAFCKFDWDEKNGPGIVVCIDATGIGSGVFDRLREMQKSGELTTRIRIVEVHNGAAIRSIQRHSKPTERELNEQNSYMNVGALAYNDLSEALKKGLRIKKEKAYLAQLPTRRFDYKSTGKLFIEPKKDYAKRLQAESPDEADSLVLANFARRFGTFGNYLRNLTRA